MTITRTNSIRPGDCTRADAVLPDDRYYLQVWYAETECELTFGRHPVEQVTYVRGLAVREHRDDYEDIVGERTWARAIWSPDPRDVESPHVLEFVPDTHKARWWRSVHATERTGRHWHVTSYTAPWVELDGSIDDWSPSSPPNIYTQFKEDPDGWGWVVDKPSTFIPRGERDLGTTAIGPEDLYAVSPGGYATHGAIGANKE